MLLHDVADGSLCPVPSVHAVIPTEWSIGPNENVDEGLQVCVRSHHNTRNGTHGIVLVSTVKLAPLNPITSFH